MTNRVEQIRVNGLELSRLMLGTAQLGLRGYGINNTSPGVDAHTLLSSCERVGINCYDTAYEYGDAELKLGNYFRGKEPPFIVSKLKIAMDLTSELEIERQVYDKTEEILRRLQVSALPALMVHDPSIVEKYGSSISAVLRKMRNEGLIQRGGISLGTEPAAQYDAIAEHMRDDIYEAVQMPLNLFDLRLSHCGALDDLANLGKIVIVRSVFLQGLFFMNETTLPEKLRKDGGPLLQQLGMLAETEGLTIAQIAISYIRDMAGVHSLVIGAENAGQMEDNVKLMSSPVLTDAARERIARTFADVPAHVITPAMWG